MRLLSYPLDCLSMKVSRSSIEIDYTTIYIAFLNRLLKYHCQLIIDNNKRLGVSSVLDDTNIETELQINNFSFLIHLF